MPRNKSRLPKSLSFVSYKSSNQLRHIVKYFVRLSPWKERKGKRNLKFSKLYLLKTQKILIKTYLKKELFFELVQITFELIACYIEFCAQIRQKQYKKKKSWQRVPESFPSIPFFCQRKERESATGKNFLSSFVSFPHRTHISLKVEYALRITIFSIIYI